MNHGRQFVVFAVVLALLCGVGCSKKKPQLPRQATAPAEPIPTPLPPEISEETPPPPSPNAPAEEPAKVEEPKPLPAKKHRRKPSQSSATAQNTGSNAANNGNSGMAMARPPANPAGEPSPDIAIAADVTSTQLMHQKQTTTELLDSTEKTLSGLHNLSHDEELMVTEVRSYVAQSRKATTDGDFERAYNLATKAHLLSDALIKK